MAKEISREEIKLVVFYSPEVQDSISVTEQRVTEWSFKAAKSVLKNVKHLVKKFKFLTRVIVFVESNGVKNGHASIKEESKEFDISELKSVR